MHITIKLFILMAILSSTQIYAEKVNYPSSEGMFNRVDEINFCQSIKTKRDVDHAKFMDILIKNAGITKEQWNNHYAYKILCYGNVPIVFALDYSLDDFKALVEYGIDLNHPIVDDDNKVSTVKDLVIYKFRTVPKSKRLKLRKIYKIIKEKGAKGCTDMPLINCGAKGRDAILKSFENYYEHYQQ